MIKYKIYPKPQEVVALDGYTSFSRLDFVGLDLFDQYTQDKARDLAKRFESDQGDLVKQVNMKLGDKILKGYSILIEDEISIQAKDSDMAYYALVTLEQILDQAGFKINNLHIYDYPSIDIRGVIEGYYGVPYSHQARYDTMVFGARFKNNVFIYAPKDDPYHREKWFDLYPEEDLDQIEELANLGKRIKNNFVWTISPFYKQMIDLDNFDSYMETLLKKFDQVYRRGVRQFGVLGDDVGTLDPEIPIKMMQALSKWGKDKGDVKDFVYCPGAYNLWDAFWNKDELNAYEKYFPANVHLFHTGRVVCSPVSKQDLVEYKTKDLEPGMDQRRDPVFWLNYPVNDIDPSYRKLHLGKVSLLDSRVDSLKGIVSNTMQEAYASLIAVFSVADYAWNTKGYDFDESHRASLEILDYPVADHLKVISDHMSNQDEKGISGLEESANIKQYLTDTNKIKDNADKIKYEFARIIETIDQYLQMATNHKLKADLEPYVLNLRDSLEAGILYLDAFKSDHPELTTYLFNRANGKMRDSYKYTMAVNPDKSRILRAESGTKYIKPFLKNLEDLVRDKVEGPKFSAEKLLYRPGDKGSKFYRIPLLFRTNAGTLLAIADKRNDHIDDWGSIDKVLIRKELGKDFADQEVIIKLQTSKKNKASAFAIDAGIIQSKITGRIFLFTTFFPESKGYFGSESGSGYVEINGKKYLELFDKEDRKFYLDGTHVKTIDGKATAFKIITFDGQPFTRYGDIYQGEMNLGNIMTGEGPLRMRKTSHIGICYSDDDGRTWTGFKDLNKYIKEDFMGFLGISPSKGYELKDSRLVVPAYFTNSHGKQSSCLIISDDWGMSWYMSAIANDYRYIDDQYLDYKADYKETYQLGEAALVKHKDDKLRMIMRNYKHGLPRHFIDMLSLDGGTTLLNKSDDLAFETQAWCQMGAIAFEKNGKEYVLISAPSSANSWRRLDGKINLLMLDPDSNSLIYLDSIDVDRGYFGYSSLEQLGPDKFAIFYERSEDANGSQIELVYREFDLGLFVNYQEDKYDYEVADDLQVTYYDQLIDFAGLKLGHIPNSPRIKERVQDLIDKYPNGYLRLTIDLVKGKDKFLQMDIDNIISIKASDEVMALKGIDTLETILSQVNIKVRKLRINLK